MLYTVYPCILMLILGRFTSVTDHRSRSQHFHNCHPAEIIGKSSLLLFNFL